MTTTITNSIEDKFPIGPFFRFPDESTGMSELESAGFTTIDENGVMQIITDSHYHSLDVIGTIYRGGEYDSMTGNVITPPTLLYGWHINYVGDLPDGWEQYAVHPQNPIRVFAS